MIFLLLLNLAFACNEKAIICQTLCKTDGEEKGIVLDGKCYCANYRPMDKYPTWVPNGEGPKRFIE